MTTKNKMEIKSLGRKSDFIFAGFSGEVENKNSHTVIKTPSNPGFHWGNYIVFDRPPRKGDFKKWTKIFDDEFTYYSQPHHYVFTWDTEKSDKGDFQEFLENDFEFETAIVLTADEVKEPKHLNGAISIGVIKNESEWNQVLDQQIMCADPKYINDYYKDFKINQIYQYKKMQQANKGLWFGAFVKNALVGNLGIFYDKNIARYQNVGTHPEYRKQGICRTLVYEAGKLAFEKFKVDTLVMEADPDYHAARIYEDVGFKKSEVNYSLTWWKK